MAKEMEAYLHEKRAESDSEITDALVMSCFVKTMRDVTQEINYALKLLSIWFDGKSRDDILDALQCTDAIMGENTLFSVRVLLKHHYENLNQIVRMLDGAVEDPGEQPAQIAQMIKEIGIEYPETVTTIMEKNLQQMAKGQ